MMKSERSKLVKTSKNGIDRISNLPDPLISHILSLIPTKEAVATSVLSTKWKFLWTSITNLDFNFNCLWWETSERRKTPEMMRNFSTFVNNVLLRVNSPSIQNISLRVCCSGCVGPSNLKSWISAVFKRVVHKFTLDLSWEGGREIFSSLIDCNVAVLELFGWAIHFKVPAAASLCLPSLQVLHLKSISCEIDSYSSVCFPNLKIMHLTNVRFKNEDSAFKLLSSSPVLDDLIIKDASYDETGSLIIHIPSLTRLSIEFSKCSCVDIIQIDCHALQFLNRCDDYPFEYLLEENLSCLVQANVEIFFCMYDDHVERSNNIIKYVQSLSNVKFLSVSGGVLKGLRIASANITLAFNNLKRLEIMLFDCVDLCVMISNVLEHMDNLEHLIMEGCPKSRTNCSHHSWWIEPLNVPKCLLSQVTTISFSYMNVDCCDQLELLRYFLKNAQVLQLLTISINHISEKEQLGLVKNISLMPKGSRACQVAFTRN